ncbi:unnamed protein product [Brassica napus]|uniref:(rape) hypothetical protein n=1 Tax=Brassica napus TaxID=3708 RepID=A0A816Q3S5_BRANA|nr:unnamed protein product [Brassica napus]
MLVEANREMLAKEPYKEGTSSYSRVQQSSHSIRVNRATNPRDSRYNPYSYVRKQDIAGRHQDASKERVWKKKQLRPLKINDHQTRDTSSSSAGEALKPRSAITGSIEPKSRTATEQPLIDSNVTFSMITIMKKEMQLMLTWKSLLAMS